MGACSSKPKTTEFEGSTEPSKETADVAADRSIEALSTAQLSQQGEAPSKEEGEGNGTDAEALQETRELIASKDEEPVIKGLSTEEEVSHTVKAEAGAASEEPDHTTAEKGITDLEDAQEVDAVAGAADIKEVSDETSPVDYGAGGDDQDKLFEEKTVVSDGVGTGDAYVDKGVATDVENTLESLDKDSGSIPNDEQSRNLQDVNESPGAESPIIGVVQPADPVHVDDVSESVGSATLETPAHVESTISEPPVETEREVLTGTKVEGDSAPLTEEAADLSCGSPQEASEEKEEVLHDNSKGSDHPVSTSDDGVGQDSGAYDVRAADVSPASADVQDERTVEETTKPETIKDPQDSVDESISEAQEENLIDESVRESHAEVSKNEGNTEIADEPRTEALKAVEGSDDAKTSTEPNMETTLEEATEGQGVPIAEEPNTSYVQVQMLAVEEPKENGQPEATPDEPVVEPSAVTKREENVEEPHAEEVTTNGKIAESADAENLEPSTEQAKHFSGEGDLAFEDASDVPLKVEHSTVELGDTPKS